MGNDGKILPTSLYGQYNATANYVSADRAAVAARQVTQNRLADAQNLLNGGTPDDQGQNLGQIFAEMTDSFANPRDSLANPEASTKPTNHNDSAEKKTSRLAQTRSQTRPQTRPIANSQPQPAPAKITQNNAPSDAQIAARATAKTEVKNTASSPKTNDAKATDTVDDVDDAGKNTASAASDPTRDPNAVSQAVNQQASSNEANSTSNDQAADDAASDADGAADASASANAAALDQTASKADDSENAADAQLLLQQAADDAVASGLSDQEDAQFATLLRQATENKDAALADDLAKSVTLSSQNVTDAIAADQQDSKDTARQIVTNAVQDDIDGQIQTTAGFIDLSQSQDALTQASTQNGTAGAAGQNIALTTQLKTILANSGMDVRLAGTGTGAGATNGSQNDAKPGLIFQNGTLAGLLGQAEKSALATMSGQMGNEQMGGDLQNGGGKTALGQNVNALAATGEILTLAQNNTELDFSQLLTAAHGGNTPLNGAAQSSAGAPMAPANPPRLLPVIEQVARPVFLAASSGQNEISIQMHPQSLGRVGVSMKFGEDGKVAATITADRPETLAMLKNDVAGLQQALQDAGFQADLDSLSFNLNAHQGGQQNRPDGENFGGQTHGDLTSLQELEDDAGAWQNQPSHSLVDIRI